MNSGEDEVRLLPEDPEVLPGFSRDAGACAREPEAKPLAEVIAEVNEQHGLDLGTADQVWFGQQIVAAVEVPAIAQAGLVNDEGKFGQVFERKQAYELIRRPARREAVRREVERRSREMRGESGS